MIHVLGAAAGGLLFVGLALAAEPNFPALTGRVVDEAGILSPQTRNQLTDMSARHEQVTGQQVVVVTLKSLQGFTIEDFGYQLGRHWGIGQKGRDTGAILIVAPNERKVRIEVGYGLEGRLTDAASRAIIEQSILPAFRRGDFNAGVLNGAAAMLRMLANPADSASEPAAAGANGWFSSDRESLLLPFLFLCIIILFTYYLQRPNRSGMSRLAGQKDYRGHDSSPYFWIGGTSSRGSSGGGDFSGSDFSGGGGSFGGGGASGSW